jgi:hypothetical protein
MTIDTLRGGPARASGRDDAEAQPLAIGEADANIFDCPACSRPLAVGTPRCPGCRTRLVAGVRASKAVGFITGGLLAGLLIGGGTTAGVVLLGGTGSIAASVPAVTAPSAVPIASAPAAAPPIASTPPSVTAAVPSAAVSALRQVVSLNERLVVDADRLAVALAATEPSSIEIARALRALAATAAFGDRISPHIAEWGAGAAVSERLVGFYGAVGGTARDGLSASLNNLVAYLGAGRSMLAILGDMPGLDADARALAATAGIDLPSIPVSDPGSPTP